MAIDKVNTYTNIGKLKNLGAKGLGGDLGEKNFSQSSEHVAGLFRNLINQVRSGEEAQKLAAEGKIDEIALMQATTQADLALQTGITLTTKLVDAMQGIDKIMR